VAVRRDDRRVAAVEQAPRQLLDLAPVASEQAGRVHLERPALRELRSVAPALQLYLRGE